MFRVEKFNSNLTRYYSSWFTNQYMYVDSVCRLDLVYLQTLNYIIDVFIKLVHELVQN
jgi:hypothetical protein